MKNEINTLQGERLSFYKLFSEKKYRVLIPIIQRDYAQGRQSTKEIRNTFLDALFNYLSENTPNRDLDFVYGSLDEINGNIDFVPLDGQQRLTTLYLLHWYLYQISDNNEGKTEFKNHLVKNDKSMFTYETRTSSTDFCDELIKNNIDFNNLLEADRDEKNNSLDNELSKTIKNQFWFFLSWKYDSTIQSMLTMLDAIHHKFAGRKNFFERLIDNENPIITFLFLNLKDFKLTDDLYIKMNSRGKPLTSFENFKAKFEQYLENISTDRTFSLSFKGTEKTTSLKEFFSYNIDTKWANLFWNYKELIGDVNTYDEELKNFIRVIFANQYAKTIDVSLKEKNDSLEYLFGTNVARKEKNYNDSISFYKYIELNALSKESVLSLIDAFEALANDNYKIKIHLPEKYHFYFNENKTFENTLKHNFETNQERICFHAYLRYLALYKNNVEGIEQWMRVIHNLTHPENTVIDNASEVASAIKTVEELLPYGNNILEYLKKDTNISLFSSWQVLEEKIKAHLITKNDDWKNKIEEVEKHRYFNGQIGFLLEFSGIMDYYNENKNCDWENKKDTTFFCLFSDYADKACKIFEESYENRKNNKDFAFERAVLTKGDYTTSASIYRKNLLSTNLVKNNIKRDHSWKRLLRISQEKEWKTRRDYVKQVLDDNRLDVNNIVDSLNEICQSTTSTWSDYLISCPDLIKYCNQGFIRFENKDNIRLYGESQSNHMHAEMYTYYLWKTYFKPNINNFSIFKEIYYNEVKSIEEYPSVILKNFCYKRIYYRVDIYYCNSDLLPDLYEIGFKKMKGENQIDKYDENIQTILSQCNFIWHEDYEAFFFTCNKSEELIAKMNQLNEKLKLLL